MTSDERYPASDRPRVAKSINIFSRDIKLALGKNALYKIGILPECDRSCDSLRGA
ncbi:hypothetical protein [Microcoleus sp. D3_18_C4]|uniref:hypothetical protein n=1 Tax=Microcoleus sp. D3_18_C4 TaxID=3055335 RepID=UPI002FD63E2A